MEKRSYKKYQDIYENLEDFCQTFKGNVLPTERELAVILATSRMTLRKAIEQALMNGIVYRENKYLIINRNFSLKPLGKILFITSGRNGGVLLGAFNRLWTELNLQLKEFDADIELFLVNNETSQKDIWEKCQKANIILLTTMNIDTPLSIEKFLNKISHNKHLIALSDPHIDYSYNFIALDNYEVGKMAANILLDFGCKKLAFISSFHIQNLMFKKRLDGFKNALIAKNNDYLFQFQSTEKMHFFERRREEITKAISSGCDGIFICSDEGIEYVVYPFIKEEIIPNKVKLLTLHGSGEALTCNPAISCINHGTNKVVKALVRHLKQLVKNPNLSNVQKLIIPDVYYTNSLGNDIPKEV